MKIIATHNSEEEVRWQSSAGGVFSILAQEVLEADGVVYGSAFNSDWTVAHHRIEKLEELYRLRGSKYVFSRIGTCVKQAVSDLAAGRKVLFSGTPCQIAAVRKRCGDNPNLLLVEVVCHGAPEAKYWERYLKELCAKKRHTLSDIKGINFRDKKTGWKNYSFSITFIDGAVFSQLHDDNLYMRAFTHDFILREACFKCSFKYPEGSCADITIGDFWGITQLAPDIDNDNGTTVVIARTAKGESAVSSMNVMATLNYKDVIKYNPAIMNSPERPSCHSEFILRASTSRSLIRVIHHFAARPLWETIYLKFALFKYRVFKFLGV